MVHHATSTGSRADSLRSSAAATRPTNSGCGSVGRDLSSGWAWVATKNGCCSVQFHELDQRRVRRGSDDPQAGGRQLAR